MSLKNDKLITVCDACFCATCWHGIFLCDDAYGAGTVEKTVKELKNLNVEHPCYWADKHLNKIMG